MCEENAVDVRAGKIVEPDKKQSQVEKGFFELEDALEALGMEIDCLPKEFAPLMRDVEPNGEEVDTTKDIVLVKVADRLRKSSRMVNTFRRRVTDVLGRSEL